MTRGACSGCFRDKKKCDMEFPCGRCLLSGRECVQRQANVSTRPKGIRYTTHACVACNRSKVRCGAERPCHRCRRLGYDCRDVNYKYNQAGSPQFQLMSLAPTNDVSPYTSGSRFPIPDLESVFQIFNQFLSTVSPFDLTDLLTGRELFFNSSMACATSVLPVHRRREFLTRMLNLAVFDSSRPELTQIASHRIDAYLDSGRVSLPRITGQLDHIYGSDPQNHVAVNSSLDDRAIINYYLYQHQYTSFPECTDGARPGVLVNLFLDPDHVDGSNLLLFGAVNPEAELYTGYTSEEYNSFQNVISSGFTTFDGFPEVLRIYHIDDVHRVMTKGLISYLSPGIEVPYEARLIHSNGRFVYARCAHLTFIKPNGQIKAVVTALMPLPSI